MSAGSIIHIYMSETQDILKYDFVSPTFQLLV